ncbi:MAG: restriction endonuclease [Candidatus Kapabacteria bacterium]|nr:restriction endonuclease [Candidatus Kapabacteria bacterium]
MDFKDQLRQLSERIVRLKDNVLTEEATKNAMIMPFLQVLGYDVFNPLEIVPEFVSDIGTKKGEKIDYAIMQNGQPVILVECKHHAQNLDVHDGQLLRYFHVSKAKFGILTNGITFRFYSDLVEPNKMDEKPFLEFKIDSIRDQQIEQLKKFHKSYFNIQEISETAEVLMYLSELRAVVQREITEPSDDFTRHFAKLVYDSTVTQKVLDRFRDLVRQTFANYINELINERLQLAMKAQDERAESESTVVKQVEDSPDAKNKITTTQEELEGYIIIRSMLHGTVDLKRVTYRDQQTFFSLLLDDNNRKPICRLWYNGTKKYIGIIDAAKNEMKHEITGNDDLYQFQEQIKSTVLSYAQ